MNFLGVTDRSTPSMETAMGKDVIVDVEETLSSRPEL